jgi:hypothetical protein
MDTDDEEDRENPKMVAEAATNTGTVAKTNEVPDHVADAATSATAADVKSRRNRIINVDSENEEAANYDYNDNNDNLNYGTSNDDGNIDLPHEDDDNKATNELANSVGRIIHEHNGKVVQQSTNRMEATIEAMQQTVNEKEAKIEAMQQTINAMEVTIQGMQRTQATIQRRASISTSTTSAETMEVYLTATTTQPNFPHKHSSKSTSSSITESTEQNIVLPYMNGIPNGFAFCWLISTIQLLFGMSTFMEQLSEENNKLRKTISKRQHNFLLSTLLLKLWSGLGYNEGQVVISAARHTILVNIRNKLMKERHSIFDVKKGATRQDKDSTQFDIGDAYLAIIDILVHEFKEQGPLPLLTFELGSSSVCLGCRRESHPPMAKEHQLLMGVEFDPENIHQMKMSDILNHHFMIENFERQCQDKDCGSKKSEKQLQISQATKYLVFGLNIWVGGTLQKLARFNATIPNHLSMDHHFVVREQTEYKLIGLISHHGESRESGHFLAYRSVHGSWYYYNDDEVSLTTCDAIGKEYANCHGGIETPYYMVYEQSE